MQEKPVTYLFDNKLTYNAAVDKSVVLAPKQYVKSMEKDREFRN